MEQGKELNQIINSSEIFNEEIKLIIVNNSDETNII